MTIKELRDLLEEYPGDAEVFVIQGRGEMMDVGISWVVDQDSAKGSVCLWPKNPDKRNKNSE